MLIMRYIQWKLNRDDNIDGDQEAGENVKAAKGEPVGDIDFRAAVVENLEHVKKDLGQGIRM